MTQEKWKDPREHVLNPQYILLSVIAMALITLGLLAKFFPDLLSALEAEQSNGAHEYWFVFVGLGVVIGVLNALTAKTANK